MTATPKPRIGLLVIDLDDTVWTWFDSWHASFSALVDGILATSPVDKDDLLAAMKDVHQARGTAEYSWLVDELEILRRYTGGALASEFYGEAIHAQNSARKAHLKLYPGVLETLKSVKASGAKVVAYTESLEFWTEWRVRQTSLDGIIDYLYSSPDHDFPVGQTRESVRTLPASEYGLRQTIHRQVPLGVSKPNPAILDLIIKRHAIPGLGVAYVGDSLDRDVAMAQSVENVHDVHAEYGQAFEKPGYELLKLVTHWPEAHVKREYTSAKQRSIVPGVSLYEGFGQLLDNFSFGPANDAGLLLDAWKQAVDVQMHFNDISLRVRSLALTVLTFTLGATGYVLVNTDPMHFGSLAMSGACVVPLIGMVVWAAFWFMDGAWYHRFLVGSVKEGERLEKMLQQNGVNVALGATISQWSALRREDAPGLLGRAWRKLRIPPESLHSAKKLPAFYRIGLMALTLAVVAVVIYSAAHLQDVRADAAPPPATASPVAASVGPTSPAPTLEVTFAPPSP